MTTKQARAQHRASTPSQGPQSAPPAADAGPGSAVDQGELIDPWATPTLDAAATQLPPAGPLDPEDVAAIAIRVARGEDVSPEDRTAASLALDDLDEAGCLVVVNRLRSAGVERQVLDGELVDEDARDHIRDVASDADALVPVSLLVFPSVPRAEVDVQVRWAEQAFAQHGMEVLIVSDEGASTEDEVRILGLDGNDEELHRNPRDDDERNADPGDEIRAALALAWETYGDPQASHAVFVPALENAEGINIDSGFYDVAQPGVIVEETSSSSTLGHELGHHLGLEHTDETGANAMTESPGTRTGFDADQASRMKQSVRVLLVPRGSTPERPAPGRERSYDARHPEAAQDRLPENVARRQAEAAGE